MTPNCEEFEIQIGMRQHGALDASQTAALEKHLAGCASCQKFAEAAGGFDTVLKARAHAEVAQVDWKKLEGGVHGLRRSYRRKLWIAPIFLLQAPVSFLLATGHLPPRELLMVGPFITVALYLAYVWFLNRPFREVMAVVRNKEDLVAGYARELRRQRLRARIFGGYNLALSLGCLAMAFAQTGLRMTLYVVGCAVLFGVWAAYDLVGKVPRLKRALAEVAR